MKGKYDKIIEADRAEILKYLREKQINHEIWMTEDLLEFLDGVKQ